MSNIIFLFLCLIVGIGLGKFKRFPEKAHEALNAFIIHISLPALIIQQIRSVEFSDPLQTFL